MIRRRTFLQLLGAGVLAAVSTVAYPFVEVLGTPRITRYGLKPETWPDDLSLRIAVLADFHACEPWMPIERIDRICEQANRLNADVILLLGDYMRGVDFHTRQLPPGDWARSLAALRAPLGVHAILGNHDYREDLAFQRDPTVRPLAERALTDVGINVMVNRAQRLEKQGRGFWLAGLGDQIALQPGSEYGRPWAIGIDDLSGTLAQVTDDAPLLLMAHEPDVFAYVDQRVSLTLCGHTHNGQVNLFGWRPISASPGSARFPRGHFHDDGRDIIVSGGLGCSKLPIRIGSWPEILLIELGNVA